MAYDFDTVHNRRGTYCTQWDYIQDRFGEAGILPFSISDHDFRVPDPIVARLHEIVDSGIYGYTRWNHHDFKGAVTGFIARRFGVELPEEWVVYSPSVMYTIARLMCFFTEPGDGVAAFGPMYDSFIKIVEGNGRKLVANKLLDKGGHYEIDFESLERALASSRVLLLCSPHNPTGRVWTAEELGRIVELCRAHRVKIISDEIHMDLELAPERRHIPSLAFYRDYPEIYLVSSCTKTLNTPGLVGSYALMPNEDVREQFLYQTRNRDLLNSASIMGMHAHMVGYTECDDYIDELRAYLRGNHEAVKAFIDSELPDLSFEIPEATCLSWIDARRVPFSSAEIQDALVHVGRVGIMPGETYGVGGEGYLRMCIGGPRSKVEEGLKRLKLGMDALYAGAVTTGASAGEVAVGAGAGTATKGVSAA